MIADNSKKAPFSIQLSCKSISFSHKRLDLTVNNVDCFESTHNFPEGCPEYTHDFSTAFPGSSQDVLVGYPGSTYDFPPS